MKRKSFIISIVSSNRNRGVTLLEVVLAIAVFTFGMLALAHLQSNLTRSSTDSNTRTVAVNLAEEVIERARAWKQLSSDVANPSNFPDVIYAFDDLTGTMTATKNRGNIDYIISAEVRDYYYNPDDDDAEGKSFSPNDPLGTGDPDFKVLEITVSWTSAEFLRGDGSDDLGDLGSNQIVVTDIIPSIPSLSSGKIVAADDGDPAGPPAEYTPGQAPDVIRINIDGDLYKESSSPVPEVIRAGELSETWFDVVTYNQVGTDAEFVRREEFVALSCQCELHTNSGGSEVGLYPTLWEGNRYSDREPVAKQWGESASNQQSIYCDVCCRDHHDGASTSADDRFDGASGGPGNHAHYNRNNQGNLVLASDEGDDYVEACRLVRKDGFFRATPDAQLQAYHGFPDLYLDGSGATTYSNYVVAAMTDYYGQLASPPASFQSAADMSVVFPASSPPPAAGTNLPTALNATTQQLRARGIYVDNLGTAAAEMVECLAPSALGGMGKTGDQCGAPELSHWLEAYPFFDLQMTFLAGWKLDPFTNVITVTNEPPETDNSHSKGLARLETEDPSQATVTTTAVQGNIGLSVTQEIYPGQEDISSEYDLYVDVNGSGPPAPATGWFIHGEITSGVGGVQANSAELTSPTGIVCNRSVNNFTCLYEFGASPPQQLKLSGYYKNGVTDLWACTNSTLFSNPVYTQTVPKSTTWTLPDNTAMTGDINGVIITIQNFACPDP